MLDFSEILHIIKLFQIEDLCNGSTPDSDSVCGGSNPSSSAKKKPTPFGVGFFLPSDSGFEEDGRAKRGKKHAGGMFFSPGENPWPCECTRMGVGARPFGL